MHLNLGVATFYYDKNNSHTTPKYVHTLIIVAHQCPNVYIPDDAGELPGPISMWTHSSQQMFGRVSSSVGVSDRMWVGGWSNVGVVERERERRGVWVG